MAELVKTRPRRRTATRFPTFFQDWMSDLMTPAWADEAEPASTMWAPRLDFMETDGAYEMQVDLPGLTKDDISIDVDERRLVVHGQREETTRDEEANMLRLERRFGRFYRSLALPEAAEPHRAEATFHDGVLTVRIPKSETKKPTKISIQ